MRTRLRMAFLAVAVALTGMFSTNAAFAEGVRTITLTPMSQKIILVPGEKYVGSIQVSNPASSDDNLNYVVTVGSYSPKSGTNSKDSYGNNDTETVTNKNKIMEWIKLDNPTGTIKPNATETVTFTIDTPKDAPAGGQYATLLVREDRSHLKSNENSGNITEVMQIGSIIYAEVAGETIEKGTITENNMPTFLTTGPLVATSMVKNEGNVHTDAEYTFQVWPLFSDEEICTNEEEPSQSLVLPDTERYHTESCELPIMGIFRAKQVVKIFGDVSTTERTIVICPVWMMIVVLFIIVAIIIWLVMRIRSRKKKN